ncbi:MAG: hypothetical protein ACUVXF_05125 [Desulfobaccales bacterium]
MRPKKSFPAVLGLLVAVTLLIAWPLGAADQLSPAQEAALFSLNDLGSVDVSPKRVVVEVYAFESLELDSFHRLLPQAWEGVRHFYAHLGVLLEMVPGRATPGNLEAGKRLRLEALPHQEWLNRTFTAFQVAPPYQARFMTVCRDKYAFAHLHLSTIHLDYRRFQDDICGQPREESRRSAELLANLMIHELGHLFGLYHAHEFVNDPILEYLSDRRTPNFMSQHLVKPGGLGFVEFQKRLVHSYLSRGKVFQQYRAVDFDPLRYLELVKRHNRYRGSRAEQPKENQ